MTRISPTFLPTVPDLTDFCVYGYPNDSISVVTTWLRNVTDNDDSFATHPAWDLPAVGLLFCPPGDEFGMLGAPRYVAYPVDH